LDFEKTLLLSLIVEKCMAEGYGREPVAGHIFTEESAAEELSGCNIVCSC
jgi:hypothetical protein